MASFHQTIIVGNVGGDVDQRFMPNGDAVSNFSVAVTESWKDQGGNKQERTTWYRVTAYRRLGEICGQYLKKGSPVMIVGRMQSRDWEKDGVKRTSWELHADSMQMLGQRPEGESAQRSSSGGGDYQRARDGASGQQTARNAQGAQRDNSGDFEDDIPFAGIDHRLTY